MPKSQGLEFEAWSHSWQVYTKVCEQTKKIGASRADGPLAEKQSAFDLFRLELRYVIPIPDDEQWLREICETKSEAESGPDAVPYLRPFAPNPNWRRAQVFIVGFNPATKIAREDLNFREFWHGLTVQPRTFKRAYANARESEESTKTTERINALTSGLAVNCLITNVCAYPGSKIPTVHSGLGGTGYKILSKLFEIVRPQCVLFHGEKAHKFAERKFGITLDPEAPPAAQNLAVTPSWYESQPVHVFGTVHLGGARRKSDEYMNALVRELAGAIRSRLNTKPFLLP